MLLDHSIAPQKSESKEISVSSEVRHDSSEERILFAFNEANRSQFFPGFGSGFPGPGERQIINAANLLSTEDWEKCLLSFRPTVLVSSWSTRPLPVSLLHTQALPLRYVCHTNGTVKHLVPREFIANGGIVTNWGNVISHNAAEQALLLVLASLRNISAWRQSFRGDRVGWGNGASLRTRALQGKTVGLHGFGNIAREMLNLLAPFHTRCLAYSHGVAPSVIADSGVTPCADLKELFRRSDVVISCEALTPYNLHSVTEEHFRLMPDDAVFVNVGRGAIVDEAAMLRVASEGRIRVACDVFEQEPPPDSSPFFDEDIVLMSPHIAAPTGDWFPRCGDYALANLERYLQRKPLQGLVTLESYDRST